MQPLIGVTVGEIVNKQYPWSPVTYGQSRTYVDAIVHAGGAPMILPLTGDKKTLRTLYERCDGLLMSGGNDIDPAIYGSELLSETIDISRRRDEQELQLIEWALADNKSVLAICRGMQLLNVALGGTLYQDIATDLPAARSHTVSTDRKDITYLAHRLKIDADSKLARIVGQTISTNAHHHQAVRKLGKGLVATAWAEDGIVEAIELPDKQLVVGVQSHPESLESETEPRWAKLFAAFVEAAEAK